jgi:heptosyltransferase III
LKTEACKKILIIRRKALGDSLLTISSITQLSEFFVGAEIDIIIDHQFVDIIKSTINDVKIFSYPDQTSNWPKFIRSQNYDIVIDYLGSARTSFWTLFSGAPIRIGYDFRIRKWAYNYRINRETFNDRELLQFAGESFIDIPRMFNKNVIPWSHLSSVNTSEFINTEYKEWEAGYFGKECRYIGVSASATWSAKGWYPENIANLFQMLTESGSRVVLIPGPTDKTIVESVLKYNNEIMVAPDTNLGELILLLGKLDLLVSTDNGTRHLAMMCKVPTLTLFGSTNPDSWTRKHPLNGVVQNKVSCSPCNKFECNVQGHPCMKELSAEKVFKEALQIIESLYGGEVE